VARAYCVWLLLGLTGAGAVALFFIPRFAQELTYHDFADQRTLWDVPHALNVLSNLPFVVFGLWGVAYLVMKPKAVDGPPVFSRWEWWTFLVIFLFVALTGFGSMYYHAQPNNDTLYWDRLPLTVVFMAFFCLVLADRVSPAAGPWLFVPLVFLGVFSVTYWHWTELAGVGDVRLYAFVQFFPLLVIPLVLLLFPGRHYRTVDMFAILGWYVLAKLLELLDKPIYSATGLVSGHTLKHFAASLGALWVWVMLRRTCLGNVFPPRRGGY
jgi:hypothetical protein